MEEYKIPIVCIKPNGQLAGYYEKASDVRRTMKVSLAELMRCVDNGNVYMGLKWMREEDYREAYFAGRGLSFPKPANYDTFLRDPVRMTKEAKCIAEARRIAAEALARAQERMNRERNKRLDERARKNQGVRCVETGRVFSCVKEVAAEYGVLENTIYTCIKDGHRLKSHRVSFEYVTSQKTKNEE